MSGARVFCPTESNAGTFDAPLTVEHHPDNAPDGFRIMSNKPRRCYVEREISPLRCTEVYAHLYQGDEHIGSINTEEYHFIGCDNDLYFITVDAICAYQARIAECVMHQWDVQDIHDYGTMVDIKRLWMRPDFRGTPMMVNSVRYLLDTYHKKRALIVTSPYPLQYEGKGSNSKAQQQACAKLTTYYERNFAMKPSSIRLSDHVPPLYYHAVVPALDPFADNHPPASAPKTVSAHTNHNRLTPAEMSIFAEYIFGAPEDRDRKGATNVKSTSIKNHERRKPPS